MVNVHPELCVMVTVCPATVSVAAAQRARIRLHRVGDGATPSARLAGCKRNPARGARGGPRASRGRRDADGCAAPARGPDGRGRRRNGERAGYSRLSDS
jgi:hypothetical protein